MPCCDGRPPVPIVVSVAPGSNGSEPAAPSSVPAPSARSDERNGQSSDRASSSDDPTPFHAINRTSLGRSPSEMPAIEVPERTSGWSRSNPRTSLTVGATRSSVVPSGTLAPWVTPMPANTIGIRGSVDAPVAGHGVRRPSTSVKTGVPSATPRTSGERPSRKPFAIPSFSAAGSGQNGTRTLSPPDASHERPAQVAVSTAAGIPIAPRATSITRRRRTVTRQPRYRAGSHWVVVPGGVVFRMRADALPTCVRGARRAARRGGRVLGGERRAAGGTQNLGRGRDGADEHGSRAGRPDPGIGPEPRVDHLLA